MKLTDFGPRLRALRGDMRLTLAEVSGRTGIAAETLSRIETGARQPSMPTAQRVLDGLGMTAEQFFRP